MKCVICDSDIRGRYLIDNWNQAICDCHIIEYCSSCGRFVRPTDLHLADGRCICSHCAPSIVSLPTHIQWVETRVRAILASYGISVIPKDVPIHLVTPSEMAKLHGTKQINLLQPGLTKTMQISALLFSHRKHKIYIFNQMPKIQFAGVLAHELLHVWQNEKGISLPPPLTEGFCNLGSYVVYKSIGNELAMHLIKNLENDPSPVYGDGFRKVFEVYKREGDLNKTMKCIKGIYECV